MSVLRLLTALGPALSGSSIVPAGYFPIHPTTPQSTPDAPVGAEPDTALLDSPLEPRSKVDEFAGQSPSRASVPNSALSESAGLVSPAVNRRIWSLRATTPQILTGSIALRGELTQPTAGLDLEHCLVEWRIQGKRSASRVAGTISEFR
jgi:hypothetical protein